MPVSGLEPVVGILPTVGAAIEVGANHPEHRRVVDGPRFPGMVLPGRADVQLIRGDGGSIGPFTGGAAGDMAGAVVEQLDDR